MTWLLQPKKTTDNVQQNRIKRTQILISLRHTGNKIQTKKEKKRKCNIKALKKPRNKSIWDVIKRSYIEPRGYCTIELPNTR